MDTEDSRKPSPEIRKVYPYFTDQQLIKAEDTLDKYVGLMLEIYERLDKDPNRDAIFEEIREKNKKMQKVGNLAGSD